MPLSFKFNSFRSSDPSTTNQSPSASSDYTKTSKTNKLIIPVLAGILALSAPLSLFPPVVPHAAAATTTTQAAVTYKLVKQAESMVSTGVKQVTYAWVSSDKTKTTEMLHVLEVDLTNPYVRLDAMSGKGGSVTTKQSVMAMVKETGAIAGINGDVFATGSSSEGAPMGAQITSGKLVVSTSQLSGMYAFAVTKDNKALIDAFKFTGDVTAADGTKFTLTGMNKSAYRTEPDNGYSHVNGLYIYTSAWTATERPTASSTTPVEALIVDGVVTSISADKQLDIRTIPTNGYILRGHKGKDSGNFITAHLKVGDTIATKYQLESLTNKQVYNDGDLQMMVGGHTLLVENGEAAKFSRDINGVSGYADRARTAVGYSKDGNTAYLITVEENDSYEGVSLKELQLMLKELGVWKAVNMDGGGSTTMIARPLGEFQVALSFPTMYGGSTMRLVTNGIGVYTNAPQGKLYGILASGPKTLFVGQQATYSIKAYDNHFNPVDPGGIQPTWSLKDASIGSFQNGVLQVTAPGTTTLNIQSGDITSSYPIEVIGQSQIKNLTVVPSSTGINTGSTITLTVKAELNDGRVLTVPSSSINWELRGFSGTVTDGKLTVNSLQSGTAAAYVIARYDGYGSMATLTPGAEKPLENFEKVGYSIDFAGLPAETKGKASVLTGVAGRESSKVLDLAYDFTQGKGSRYAYAKLNGTKGITIDSNPTALSLDVMGDKSMNWLRAEVIDANGKSILLTIADKVDWTGWKNIKIDLTKAGITGPAKPTKLYLVNLEQDQDERLLKGEVAFDNLVLQYPSSTVATKQPKIVLTVGKTKATVDGKAVTLPGAPFTQKGTYTNFLPLRFVSEQLGASIKWDNKDKRVTVLRGSTMLELWVDKEEMVVNGSRVPLSSPPVLLNNSVYVPVRVVSEQLGQKVTWDEKKKTITIE